MLGKIREENGEIEVKEDRASFIGKLVIPSENSLTELLINFS